MVRKGFTLIELLVVMAIISILIGFVIVKLKPFQRTLDAYNARGAADIRQMEKALAQAMIDGHMPPANVPAKKDLAKWICQYSVKGFECIDPPIEGVDLSYLVPTYIPALPEYPLVETGGITGYRIYKDGAFFIIEAAF